MKGKSGYGVMGYNDNIPRLTDHGTPLHLPLLRHT